jgi:hypothetical protein
MGKIYGREPAVWMAALGALWVLLSAFGIHFSDGTQSVVTALVAAVLGGIVAVQVHDGIIAAATGLVTAGVSLVAYYWMHWDAEGQAKLVAAVMLVVALFVTRPNVTAPVDASASPAGKLVA